MKNKNEFQTIIFVVVLISFSIFTILNSKKDISRDTIRIGCSDDLSGFVLYYIGENKHKYPNLKLETYVIHDCWTSTSQWALRSEVFDMAVLCAEATEVFIDASHGTFQDMGAVMKNSDVIVVAREPVGSVAMIQNKFYQRNFIVERYGKEMTVHPAMANAIPYLLARGNVDAAVIDWAKAVQIEYPFVPASEYDYASFKLISEKKFAKTKKYKQFTEIYNQSVKELNSDEELLKRKLEDYIGIEIEEERWKNWKIKIEELTPVQNI